MIDPYAEGIRPTLAAMASKRESAVAVCGDGLFSSISPHSHRAHSLAQGSTATRERRFFVPRPVDPNVNSTSPEDETSGSKAVRQESPGWPGFDRPGLKLQNPGVPNTASILKEEIIRVARKEIRNEIASLRKTVTTQRSDIAELKRRAIAAEKGRRCVAVSSPIH